MLLQLVHNLQQSLPIPLYSAQTAGSGFDTQFNQFHFWVNIHILWNTNTINSDAKM